MKEYIKLSKRIMLYQFAVSFLCIVVLPGIYFFLRDSLATSIFVFSLIMSVYLLFLCFVEANKVGIRQLRNPKLYEVKFFKGFIFGLLGQLPVWFITLILVLNKEAVFLPFAEDFRVYIANIFTLEFIWILSAMNFSFISYMVCFCLVPAMCFFGYLLGAKGLSFEDKFGSLRKGE